MLRIRSIKPDVHLDEDLWDLEEQTGLPIFRAFVGLWGVADREGRFLWRPRKLKALILPYWNGSMEEVLNALQSEFFIIRYESEGRAYGWVRTFSKHQVINLREAQSKLPAPSEEDIQDAQERMRMRAQGEGEEKRGDRVVEPVDIKIVPVEKPPPVKRKPGQAKTSETWLAYAESYRRRYGVEPARSAKVNGVLSNLVDQFGAENAPLIAGHYLTSNYQFYLARGHPVDLMLSDGQKLLTEFRTGQQTTATQARQMDRRANNAGVAAEVVARLEKKGEL